VTMPSAIAQVLSGDRRWHVEQGDCLDVLRSLPDACIDALVTDPPAGIGFMGKTWDHDKGGRDVWVAWLGARMREAYRVLKPGAHGLVWALPRTSHWTAYALEDAGFEIVDRKSHVFGSGFPKSVDVAKAIDKMRDDDVRPVCRFLRAAMEACGIGSSLIAERFGFHSRMVDHWAARDTDSQPTCPTLEQWEQLREVLGFGPEMDAEVARLNARKGEPGDAWRDAKIVGEHDGNLPGLGGERFDARDNLIREPSEDAKRWAGWGTALKPAVEDWWLIRKPRKGTIARNVLEHGTGALNIDGCRVPHASAADLEQHAAGVAAIKARGGSMDNSWKNSSDLSGASDVTTAGRWPANCLLSHSSGCERVGTKKVKAAPSWNDNRSPSLFTGDATSTVHHADGDGFETVDDWECVDGCPVKELDGQSGTSKSPPVGSTCGGQSLGYGGTNRAPIELSNGHGDEGGASRFFKTFHGSTSTWPGDISTNATGAGIESGDSLEAAESCSSSKAGGSGNKRKDLSLKATRSTTRTTTTPTTLLEISNVSQKSGTTTTTNDFESTTESSTDSKRGAAADAESSSRSTASTSDALERITATARPAQSNTSDCGDSAIDLLRDRAPFFYTAKASRSDREKGLEHLSRRTGGEATGRKDGTDGLKSPRAGAGRNGGRANDHPTVKSDDLMRYLCRLITPRNGIVLDIFTGSGSTGKAALAEGFRFIGVEIDSHYCDIAIARIIGDAPLLNSMGAR
jgi:hypothetical protein